MKRDLPGDHSVQRYRVVWESYDWSNAGEEWTLSPEWKQSVIDDILLRYFESGKTVLEIGPGAGRWTETLQTIAKHLILVDVSERCIELCRDRFSHCDNIEYFVNDGTSLGFLAEGTVDCIWSFDVFVHISHQDIEEYISEFSRVLKKGGCGVIHHAKSGGRNGGWRSRMTAELFAEILKKQDLILLDQFDSWGDGQQFGGCFQHDMVTVFQK